MRERDLFLFKCTLYIGTYDASLSFFRAPHDVQMFIQSKKVCLWRTLSTNVHTHIHKHTHIRTLIPKHTRCAWNTHDNNVRISRPQHEFVLKATRTEILTRLNRKHFFSPSIPLVRFYFRPVFSPFFSSFSKFESKSNKSKNNAAETDAGI